jgi:hypothetical protein
MVVPLQRRNQSNLLHASYKGKQKGSMLAHLDMDLSDGQLSFAYLLGI